MTNENIEYYWTELFKVFFSVSLDKYFDAVAKISTDVDIIKNLADSDFLQVGMKPDEIKVLRSRFAMCNDTKGSDKSTTSTQDTATEDDDDKEVKYRGLCITNQERMQSFIDKMNGNAQIWELYRALLSTFNGEDDKAISYMIYCLNLGNLGTRSRPAQTQSF